MPRTRAEIETDIASVQRSLANARDSNPVNFTASVFELQHLQEELSEITAPQRPATPNDFKCEAPPKPSGQTRQELTWKFPKIPFEKVDAARKKSMASFAAFEAAQKEVFMTSVEQLCDECFDNGKTREDIVAALEALAVKKL
jgi:hypothetical protein